MTRKSDFAFWTFVMLACLAGATTVLNVTRTPVEVRRGDRLAQGVILSYVRAAWRETQSPEQPSRGGFGSTGD